MTIYFFIIIYAYIIYLAEATIFLLFKRSESGNEWGARERRTNTYI